VFNNIGYLSLGGIVVTTQSQNPTNFMFDNFGASSTLTKEGVAMVAYLGKGANPSSICNTKICDLSILQSRVPLLSFTKFSSLIEAWSSWSSSRPRASWWDSYLPYLPSWALEHVMY